MTIQEYQEKAKYFISNDFEQKDMLINSALGLAGESGEVIDLIKKHVHSGHELNKEKIIEEAGDVCWYISELATSLNIDMEEFFKVNINKLSKRYPNGFDKERSIHRKELGIE